MPNMPTFGESRYACFTPQQWTWLFVPAVTNPVSTAFSNVLKSPDVLGPAG